MIQLHCRRDVEPDVLRGTVVQLRLDLRHAKPPIWRRLLVPGDIALPRLHDVFQVAMGWTDSHLHAFHQGDQEFSVPDPDSVTPALSLFRPVGVHDEAKHRLSALVTATGDAFRYDYDFGDGWEHDIRVEAITPAETQPPHAQCLAGRRACPPEDCGGIGGYFDLLPALAHPKARRSRELLQWLGSDYDPTRFDLAETNELLSHLKL